jgi:alkylhydroperoxidase family enzyme
MTTSGAGFLPEPPHSPDVQHHYDESMAEDGYVSHFTQAWCWRPDVFGRFLDMRGTLLEGSTLSQREIAVVVATTVSGRRDAYCSLAWGTKLSNAADAETAAAILRGEDPPLSVREAGLVDWVRAVLADPNATTETDVQALRVAGFSDREIFEATALMGVRIAFSTVDDALGLAPDHQLVEQAPAAVRDAVTYGRAPA